MFETSYMINTFVYGSLMFDAVWDLLITNRYQKTAVRLEGHARVCVKGEVYPGLIKAEGRSVDGILVTGVCDADIRILDRFEGEHYRRVPVEVTGPQGESYQAETYLFSNEGRFLLSDSEWSVDDFRDRGMQVFLAEYRGFR